MNLILAFLSYNVFFQHLQKFFKKRSTYPRQTSILNVLGRLVAVRRSLRKCALVPYGMNVRGYNFFII